MNKINNRKLTPAECIEDYPDLNTKWNWLPQDIGRLVRMKIVDGYVLSGGSCLVKEESLIKLIKYCNSNSDMNIILI